MEKRYERLNIPVTASEKEAIIAASTKEGETASSWVRKTLLHAAKKAKPRT